MTAAGRSRALGAWERSASALAELPSPVLVLDRERRVVHVTRALGPWTAAALEGTALDERAAPARRAALAAAIDVALAGGGETIDVPLSPPAGTPRETWWELTVSPLRDDRDVVGALVIAHDVTTRRGRERLMDDTQGVAHFGVWEWDVSEPTAWWSDELYRIYGVDPAAHVPSYEDYLSRVHPDDRDRVKTAIDGVMTRHQPFSHEERVFHRDGQLRYLHTWAEPVLDEAGDLIRLVGVCLDITDEKLAQIERAESEARLRAVFDASPIGIATVDRSGAIVDVNPALRHQVGRTAAELIGGHLASICDEEDAARCPAAMEHVFREGRMPPQRIRVRRDGEPLWARIAGTRVTDRLAVFLLEDLSLVERADAADQLATSRLIRIQELEQVSEWKSVLLQVASHEIKNPLSPMLLVLDLLQRGRYGALEPRQMDAVALVAQQAERLGHLIRDIVDFALIEQGRLRVEPREVDINTIVDQVVATFRPLAARWGIRLDEQALSGALRANVDPSRIEQVLVNLLSNAVKFTPEGGHIEVAAVQRAGEIQVSVADTGPGLTADQASDLFRPFAQGPAPTRGDRGSGLGLFISKNLVEAQGGRLWLEPADGTGARFCFALPAIE